MTPFQMILAAPAATTFSLAVSSAVMGVRAATSNLMSSVGRRPRHFTQQRPGFVPTAVGVSGSYDALSGVGPALANSVNEVLPWA